MDRAPRERGGRAKHGHLLRRQLLVRRTAKRVGREWKLHTPKSGKARRVPFMPWLAADLRAYLEQHPRAADPDTPLWPAGRTGTPNPEQGPVDYERRWEPGAFYRGRYVLAVRAAGLPTGRGGVNFHSLRHTFASLAASRGAPVRQVAAWMRHANEYVTSTIYTHLFAAPSAAAVAAMASEGRPTATPVRSASVTVLRPTATGPASIAR